MQEIIAEQERDALSSIVKPFRELPMLVVLCGPSHAGKTTFANQLNKSTEKFAIISTDQIRKQLSVGFQNSRYESRVWDIYESMKRKALEKGCNVVLDACHMSERARWHALQGPNQYHRKICVVFDLPLQTIMERCDKENRVSSEEVRRMWQAFQHSKPSPNELKLQGFDDVCSVREHHVRDMQSVWPQREAHKTSHKFVAFGDKADGLMSVASSILSLASPNSCIRPRAAPIFGALWQSPRHAGSGKPTFGWHCRGTFRHGRFIFHHLRVGPVVGLGRVGDGTAIRG